MYAGTANMKACLSSKPCGDRANTPVFLCGLQLLDAALKLTLCIRQLGVYTHFLLQGREQKRLQTGDAGGTVKHDSQAFSADRAFPNIMQGHASSYDSKTGQTTRVSLRWWSWHWWLPAQGQGSAGGCHRPLCPWPSARSWQSFATCAAVGAAAHAAPLSVGADPCRHREQGHARERSKCMCRKACAKCMLVILPGVGSAP